MSNERSTIGKSFTAKFAIISKNVFRMLSQFVNFEIFLCRKITRTLVALNSFPLFMYQIGMGGKFAAFKKRFVTVGALKRFIFGVLAFKVAG